MLVSTLPINMLEMQILGPNPRSTESEILQFNNLYFNKSSRSGSPIPRTQTDTSLWPVRNRVTQQELGGR